MNESMITKAVRRSNTTLLVVCLVGLLVVGALAVLNLRYFYNFFFGPFDVTAEELIAVSDPKTPQEYWVRITGDDIFDTGIQYIETSDSGRETVEFSYLALALGDRLLLVKQPGEPVTDLTLRGSLEKFTSEEQVEIIDDLVSSEPMLEGVFLPYLLRTGSFRAGGTIGLVLGGLAALGCVIGLVVFMRRNADPSTHPILKSLNRFGPIEFTTGRIDAELAGEHTTLAKHFHLTKNWLVYNPAGKFEAMRFEDLAWLYMHVTTHKSYGITVGKTFAVMAYDKFGAQAQMVVGNKEQPAQEVIQAIGQRAPWAVGGFSAELNKAWKKDRANFLAEVEKRKAQLAG